MSVINSQSEAFWSAKEQEKKREDAARNAAIIRAMNAESAQLKETKFKLNVSRAMLLVVIAFNFYAAAKGWGIL